MEKPYYVQEVYTDRYKTLSQAIMYRVGDEREQSFCRSKINPNLEILKEVIYLDENMQQIKED